MMKIKTFDYLMLAVAVLLAGLIPIVYKLGSDINPLTLAFFISLVGTVVSLGVVLYKGTGEKVIEYLSGRRSLAAMLVTGLFTFTALTLIFSYTTHYTTAALVAVIYRSWPLLVLVLAPLMMRERITKMEMLGVAIGFGGLAAVFLNGTGASLPVALIPFAVLIFIGALLDAVTCVVQKRYHYELTSSIFIYNLISFLVLLPLALYFNAVSFSLALDAVAAIAFLGVLQNVMMTFFFVYAFRSIKTAVAGNAFLLAPFVTMVLGAAFLSEPIIPSYIVIAASVGIGLLVVGMAPKTGNYITKNKKHETTASLPTIYDVTSAFVGTKSNAINAAIQGNGRVLAFYKKTNGPEKVASGLGAVSAMRDAMSTSGDCFIFTNKEPTGEVRASEFEYIKDIVGHDDGDLLVLGAGKPESVEAAFGEIHSRFENGGVTELKM
jgi:drug/metabolite transporter (DMT)-like permease